LIVTFIYATYFTKSIAPNEIDGTLLWSRGITISAILIALFSPIFGAMADKGPSRKKFLIAFTLLSIIATTFLYDVLPGEVVKALSLFIIANFAFEMGMVFYNAYLPQIAPRHKIGRISGYGWALGYLGGLLCLLAALIWLVNPEVPAFGFTKEAGENIRAVNLLVALWFLAFSIPAFIWLKDGKKSAPTPLVDVMKLSFWELKNTIEHIGQYKQILTFLLARIFYNDGLITIFAFGGIYAAGTFGFDFTEIISFGIALNVAAGLGAFAFGFFDDLIGGKKTIQVSNLGLIVATLIAVFAPDKTVFWIAGILIGIFSGPNQASSRSLMARLTPKEKQNEFYGFYAFSGKATTFAGPFLFGLLTEIFQSQRAGVAVIVLFFMLGYFILSHVNPELKSEN
jgi:MFS transporter, UMF1 family